MSDCPFHDLDPSDTVILECFGHPVSIASAQLMCETWHDTESIREYFSKTVMESLGGIP